MNKYGTLIAPNALQFVRLLPGTIDRVWQLITDAEQRALWFAGGPTELKPGGTMQLVFNNSQFCPPDPVPDKYKDFGDGFVSEAKVLRCEPPTLFEIAWEGVVRFELEEMEGKVRLTLTHEKLEDNEEAKIGTLAGWHSHLDIMEDRLHDRAPRRFWPAHMKLEEEYAKLLGH